MDLVFFVVVVFCQLINLSDVIAVILITFCHSDANLLKPKLRFMKF